MENQQKHFKELQDIQEKSQTSISEKYLNSGTEARSKLISFKGIEHEIKNDVPFIGALIVASTCLRNCKGCHNHHLKSRKHSISLAGTIIDEVRANKFNQGIILGGLEWTDTPVGMLALIEVAFNAWLQVMLYTYMDEDEFKNKFPQLYALPIWVKFGSYDESLITETNIQYGIKLATSNQKIKFLGM